MYKIIGSDQKVYGPVTADVLRQWLAEGRLNSASLVQPEGSSEWKPISSFPEFAPPPPVAAPVIVTPPPAQPPAYVVQDNNSMATAGFVFGLLSIIPCCCFGFFFAVAGLVFSSIALSRANKHPREEGKSLAIAGLVLSILGLMSCLTLPWFLSVFSHGGPGFKHDWSYHW